MPYGGKAALAQVSGYVGGLIFFIDGDKACNPMQASPELLLLMHEVGEGGVIHVGRGL